MSGAFPVLPYTPSWRGWKTALFSTIFLPISKPHFEKWLHLLQTVNRTKKRYCKYEAVWDVTLCGTVRKGKEPRRNLHTKVHGRTPHRTGGRAPNMKMWSVKVHLSRRSYSNTFRKQGFNNKLGLFQLQE
jgi:hypothetical protein